MRQLTEIERRGLIERAVAAAPEECCGLITMPAGGGTALSFYPMENVAEFPEGAFKISADELFAQLLAFGLRSEVAVALYHSHPASGDPRPSEKDREMAVLWPGLTWVIIGLGAEPEVWSGVLVPA